MKAESKFKIREIACGERATCAEIYANAWNSALPVVPRIISEADFRAETEGERILVGILNGRIVGFISIWEPDSFIHHLYVDPLTQGAGLGRALILRLEETAGRQAISLKCQLANISALGFYKLLGFAESGETGTDEFGNWARLVKIPPGF